MAGQNGDDGTERHETRERHDHDENPEMQQGEGPGKTKQHTHARRNTFTTLEVEIGRKDMATQGIRPRE